MRSVFDGRYTYSRYFSPKQHNQPQSPEGIFALNDVELFDLEADREVRPLRVTAVDEYSILSEHTRLNCIPSIGLRIALQDFLFHEGETGTLDARHELTG